MVVGVSTTAQIGPSTHSADDVRMRLLNAYQRDFPLTARPFAQIAEQMDLDEQAVLEMVSSSLRDGVLSRVGAVFAPGRIGASALAALAAPEDRLDEVAEAINAHPEVNHNYQREHAFNVWFVITAASGRRFAEVVQSIESRTGCTVLVMPLEQAFHIDLGFDFCGKPQGLRGHRDSELIQPMSTQACLLPELERAVMAELERGLPLVARPFHTMGQRVGVREDWVIDAIERWLVDGRIKRFGFVVRHHELGFSANAMCVWDVPDQRVAEVGERLACEPAVTLCYRRTRARPHWPYNLFCMIHGRSRDEVLRQHAGLVERCRLGTYTSDVLFSTRRFKQRGSRYFSESGQ